MTNPWKFIISLLLCVCVFSTTFLCQAEEKNDDTIPNEPNLTAFVTDKTTYEDYLSQFKDYPNSSVDVNSDCSSIVGYQDGECSFDGKKCYLWTGNQTRIDWIVNVGSTAMYNIELLYRAKEGSNNPYDFAVLIDGESPFGDLTTTRFPRVYKDKGSVKTNSANNQIASPLKEEFVLNSHFVCDENGYYNDPFCFGFTAGEHTVSFVRNSEDEIYLFSLNLLKLAETKSYNEVKKEYKKKDYKEVTNTTISIEGESGVRKSSETLGAKSDTSSASLSPSSPMYDVVNYIGGSNWSYSGESLIWSFNVKKSGLYKIGFRYRQNYVLGANSYRRLEIDGVVPFKEAKSVSFPYCEDWEYTVFGDKENDEPYLFYLDKGKHEIKLTVTLGKTSNVCRELKKVVYDLGDTYQNMVMVMGTSPDANRNYDLFKQIPSVHTTLKSSYKKLNQLADELADFNDNSGSSLGITVKNASSVIKQLLDNPYKTQKYKDEFYSNYCSLGSALTEMMKLPVDLDEMMFISPDDNDRKMASWTSQIKFSFYRFIYSFVMDYNNLSGTINSDKSITLWVGWGRDQVKVLNNAIQEMFTPETGIGVNVKIVDATLIQALLSGQAPDCYLRLSRSSPVDLAMRGALYDLRQFDDFDDVLLRFMPNAEVPYCLGDGCYALPDTQSFNMMFYRNDIFEKYGLSVPKTWDEFIDVSTFLFHKNLQVGIPYTKISTLGTTNAGIGALSLFPTLMLQNNYDIYNSSGTKTNLSLKDVANVFGQFTDLYSEYGFPVSYDFYNRFRSGEMPLGIASYTQYNTIAVAATEIKGCWGMRPIPGTIDENGNLNNLSAGGGTGSVILNASKNKDLAWEFLKWWTSAKAQTRYAKDIEAVLGAAARVDTATVDALKQLSWEEQDLKSIVSQWENVKEVREIPGSYYTIRSIDQAFWQVVNNHADPTNTLKKWAREADAEITRKRDEYHLN